MSEKFPLVTNVATLPVMAELAGKGSPNYQPTLEEFVALPLPQRLIQPLSDLANTTAPYVDIAWDSRHKQAFLFAVPMMGLNLPFLRQLKAWQTPQRRREAPEVSLRRFLDNLIDRKDLDHAIVRFKHLGRPAGLGLISTFWSLCQMALTHLRLSYTLDGAPLGLRPINPLGLVWRPDQETAGQYIRAVQEQAQSNAELAAKAGEKVTKGALQALLLEGQVFVIGCLVDETQFFSNVYPDVMEGLTRLGVDWDDLEGSFLKLTGRECDPENRGLVPLLAATGAEPKAEALKVEPIKAEPKAKAPAILSNTLPATAWWAEDATSLFEEVLTGRKPMTFTTNGVSLLTDDLPSARETNGKRGPRGVPREARPLDENLPEVARSRFAVLPERIYHAATDMRRSAAKQFLEYLLGDDNALPYHRRDTVNLLPDQLGLVPAIIGGQYGQWRDRLARVRVINPDMVTRLEGAALQKQLHKPLRFKVTRNGKVEWLTFTDTVPAQVAICPSGWLRDTTPWWLAGLFGTPLDPTLLEFCETMPAVWWEELQALLRRVEVKGEPPVSMDALMRAMATAG